MINFKLLTLTMTTSTAVSKQCCCSATKRMSHSPSKDHRKHCTKRRTWASRPHQTQTIYWRTLTLAYQFIDHTWTNGAAGTSKCQQTTCLMLTRWPMVTIASAWSHSSLSWVWCVTTKPMYFNVIQSQSTCSTMFDDYSPLRYSQFVKWCAFWR